MSVNGSIALFLVILVVQYHQITSSKSATTASFLKHLRTLADIGDTMTRTMKSSPIYYVKKLLSTSSKRPGNSNSPIYKLPLKLLSNAKPTGVVHGLISSSVVHRPASSNIFQIPLKFVSNGRPTGITTHSSQSLINHAVSSLNNVNKYPTMSNIIRLPLTFMSNAKPIGMSLLHGQHQILNFPLQPSNIINLPLQFVSNAKPYVVNFNPFMF